MGCAAGIVKYLVFAFNLLFFIVGTALLTVGIVFVVNIDEYAEAIGASANQAIAGPIALIVVGSIILVISFFGCCGAIKENTCLLTTYACILLAILIVKIAIGTYALITIKDSGDFADGIKNELKKSYQKYNKDDAITKTIDKMQNEFKCCGAVSPAEFPVNNIPESCCDSSNGCTTLNVYPIGCTFKLTDFLKDLIKGLGIAILCLALTEVIGSVLSLCLANSIRREKRMRHY